MLLLHLANHMLAWPFSWKLWQAVGLATMILYFICRLHNHSHNLPPVLYPPPTARTLPQTPKPLLARAYSPEFCMLLAVLAIVGTVMYLLMLVLVWKDGVVTIATGLASLSFYVTLYVAIHAILRLVTVALDLSHNILLLGSLFMLVNTLWSLLRRNTVARPEDVPWTLLLVAANGNVCALWALYTTLFDRSAEVDARLCLEAADIYHRIKADKLRIDARIVAVSRQNLLLHRQAGLQWAEIRVLRKLAFIIALRTPAPGIPYHPRFIILHQKWLQLSEEARPKDVSDTGLAFLFNSLILLSRSREQVEAEIQSLEAVHRL